VSRVSVPNPSSAAPEEVSSSRAQQALALFENIDDAVLVHDLEGRIVNANPAACRRLGYSREELLQLTTRDLVDPADGTGLLEQVRAHLAHGQARFESHHLTKNGDSVPVAVNASLIAVGGGQVVLAVLRDVSRRQRAERRLAAQNRVTRVLTEAARLADASTPLLEAICEGIGWDLGALWTMDPNTGDLRCFDLWKKPGLSVPGFEALTRRLSFTPGLGLPGRAWSEGRPVWIADLQPDSDFLRAARAIQEGLHAGIVFPVQYAKQVVGIVEFYSRSVQDRDVPVAAMLEALASQIGQFIERQQAEEERDRFFTLSLDMLCVAGFDGFFKRLNPQWERTLGYSIAELLAWPYIDFVHPDDRSRTMAEAQRLAEGATTFSFENRYCCKDGSYKWFAWTAAPVASQRLVYAAAHDITDRKHSEDDLHRMSKFLDSVVENIPTMLFIKDAAELRFERINKAAEDLLGVRRDELIGRNDYDFFPKEQADFFTEKDREVLACSKLTEITEEIKTASGRKMLFTRKIPLLDDEGRPKYLLGISEDITERVALEESRRCYAEAQAETARQLQAKNQELAASESRYRQLTEASLDGIIVADQHGRVTVFNPAAERIFGFTAAQMLGQPITRLMPSELQDRHQQGLERFVAMRRARVVGRTIELQGRRRDGSVFPLELALSAVELGSDVQFLGTIRDLTERNRLRDRMLQTEKLASIGLLSAGVAHEINNPLAYVANNLAVLERDLKGLMSLVDLHESARPQLAAVSPATAAQLQALIEKVDLPYIRDNLDRVLTKTREGVQRVARIVQSLRGFARTDRPQLELVQLSDLVESSLEMIRGRLQRRGIRVEVNVGPTVRLQGVPTQLGQVFLNLLVNALQAIEAASRQDHGLIRLSACRAGDEIVIECTDNGCGISTQDLPRLFDPFFTTKPVGEGTGLGLSIAHGIVTGHGGRVEVQSQVGAGSTFRIFLPQEPHRGSL
jgi:PAS domain S-box-containing protein